MLLLAAGAVAAIMAGCGGDSGDGRLLTSRQASDLKSTLSQVEENVAAKNCTTASQQATAFQQQVQEIRRLNSSLRSALRASSRRLETLVSDNCQTAAAPVQTTTTPTTTDTGPTGTTGPNGKVKKEKKSDGEKPPKETPSGQDGETPPGQDNGGGGAGVPGESGGDGTGSP